MMMICQEAKRSNVLNSNFILKKNVICNFHSIIIILTKKNESFLKTFIKEKIKLFVYVM